MRTSFETGQLVAYYDSGSWEQEPELLGYYEIVEVLWDKRSGQIELMLYNNGITIRAKEMDCRHATPIEIAQWRLDNAEKKD